MRGITEKDARVLRLKSVVTDPGEDETLREIARNAYAVIEALDSVIEQLELEARARERSQFNELHEIERAADARVADADKAAAAWRDAIGEALGLAPYDVSILSPDDACAKIQERRAQR